MGLCKAGFKIDREFITVCNGEWAEGNLKIMRHFNDGDFEP